MSSWTELLGPRARLMITISTQKGASDLRTLGAAYRNRTDDLRITRSPARRSVRATCTDGTAHVPECSQRTECSGLPVHDPVHGLGQPAVTECYWMSWWHTREA